MAGRLARQRRPRGVVGVRAAALAVALASASCAARADPRGACASRGLAFAPSPAARYTMVVDEHDTAASPGPAREPYRSTLSFTRAGAGWTAVEGGYNALRTPPAQVGDLTGAEAHWALDPRGVPSAPPRERGQAREGILQHLSLFAFRPIGYAFASTCPGEMSSSTWTDAAGRVRSFRFRVERIEGGEAVLHAAGTVATAANAWSIEGELRVSLADGLTGEARLHETGPGAPRVNDRMRTVRVTRE